MLCPTLKAGGAHEGWFSELSEAGLVTLGELDAGQIQGWVLGRLDGVGGGGRDWEQLRRELEAQLDRLLQGGE
jgi:hypothetical protein